MIPIYGPSRGAAHEQEVGPRNPFVIPELLEVIGQFMHPRTLTICCRVSHSWQDAFGRSLWAYLEIRPFQKNPYSRLLREHALHIRRLWIHHETPWVFLDDMDFPNLLDFTIQNFDFHDEVDTYLPHRFILRHQSTLTSVTINQDTTRSTVKALGQCKHLQHLQLGSLFLDIDEWVDFYNQILSHLRTLSLNGSWFRDNCLTQETFAAAVSGSVAGQAKIQELTLISRHANETLVDACRWLLKHCPSLSRLEWSLGDRVSLREDALRVLAKEIREFGNIWKQLEAFNFPGWLISLGDLVLLLESLPRLTELCLPKTNFDPPCWVALQSFPHHLETLRVLDIGDCKGFPGSSVQQILCTLVNIITFKAPPVNDSDILNDNRPWVCMKLKTLHFSILLSSKTTQPMVLQRLSTLTSLESLELCEPDLALHLEQLRNLRRLKSLRGPYPFAKVVRWERPEAQWVLENWPELKTLRGYTIEGESLQFLGKYGVDAHAH